MTLNYIVLCYFNKNYKEDLIAFIYLQFFPVTVAALVEAWEYGGATILNNTRWYGQ